MSDTKVAVLTAASEGIGGACARELAARGYQTVIMSRSSKAVALAEKLGGIGVQGSVQNPDDLRALVDCALESHGRVDAVVNSTGHPPAGPLLELTDADWQAGLDLNLLNVVRMARLVTPVMVQQGAGAIVNISTFAAFEPSLDFPISSSLRAALAGFTKLYADEYGARGIRMNSVLPGYIYTEADEADSANPLGRPGTTDEIAKTVAFLLSADAGYITGQNIRVDGGLTRAV